MDNTRGMVTTNDWGRYEALQIKLMRAWRDEEQRARMEVVFFEEPEVKDVGHDCQGPPEAAETDPTVRDTWDREIDLGGSVAQPPVPDDGGRAG